MGEGTESEEAQEPQSPPPVMNFLKQASTSYTFLDSPTTRDSVFKYMSLCGHFSFRARHESCPYKGQG